MYEGNVATIWANMLTTADEFDAPNFAWHLAEIGCTPENVRMMAGRWRDEGFEPESFAGELEMFADKLQRVSGSRNAVFR